MATTTYLIPDYKLEGLQAAFAKLDKRFKKLRLAERLGMAPITLSLTGKREAKTFKRHEDAVKEFTIEFVEIEVTGENPHFPGWQFAASLDHDAETGLCIINKSPMFTGDIPVSYRSAKSICNHCNVFRPRNNTFLLSKEDGTWTQVGRQCMKDFLGHKDPEALATAAEMFCAFGDMLDAACGELEDMDRDYAGGRVKPVYSTLDVLAYAVACVEKNGYHKSSDEAATKDAVRELLDPKPVQYRDAIYEKWIADRQFTPDRLATAAAIIAWVQAWTHELSDYEHNIFVALAPDYCKVERLGIIVSVVAAYERHLGTRAARAKKLNEHFGIVKRRIDLTLSVLRGIAIDSQFGTTMLYSMEDEAGRCFMWKSSSCGALEIGNTYKVKATVKRHDVYAPRASDYVMNQTWLTRVAVVSQVTPDAPAQPEAQAA